MKKILLFVCLSTCSLLLSAQNYEPFLFGKTYKYLNPIDSTIITHKIDSVTINNDGDSIFYTVKEIGAMRKYGFIFTSDYTKTSEGYLFGYGTLLKSNLKVNAILLHNSQYLKYKGKELSSFLNITDSVKVFYLIDDSTAQVNLDTIYLSKNYGFINGFNNYSLYSIKELNIGNNHIVSYLPSIGDTVVWTHRIIKDCIKSNEYSYRLNVVTQKEIDEINSEIKFSNFWSGNTYEYIENGIFYYNLQPLIYDGGYSSILREEVGYFNMQSSSNLGPCLVEPEYDDTVVYFKGKAGEFGDRSQLDKILSFEDIKLNTSVKIFPNPSEGKLTIDFASQEAKEISVIDNLGKLIQQINTSNKQLELILDKGIYVIKVMTKNQVQVEKVLVE